MTSDPTDRRAALRERHRRAIVDAAAALMDETGGVGFTVDELATRADVSRRTVFNHFPSVDDVVAAVCAEVLDTLVDHLLAGPTARPATGDSPAAMFDEVAEALRSTDLVGPMAHLTHLLGPADGESPARAATLLRSFHAMGERFGAVMARRHPSVDEVQVQLLAGTLIGGLTVLHRRWFAATGAADDDASRQVWAALVEQLLTTARDGYGRRS